MKLTKTPAQSHDYNLKLTKDELVAIHRVLDVGMRYGDWEIWNNALDLIVKEGEKLGNASSE